MSAEQHLDEVLLELRAVSEERARYRAALERCRDAWADFGNFVMVGDGPDDQTIEAFVDSVLGEGKS